MNMIKKTSGYRTAVITVILPAVLLFIANCTGLTSNGPVQTATAVPSAAVTITVEIGEIGLLTKQKAIDLRHLILTISCPGENTIHDTTSLNGAAAGTRKVKIDSLAAPRQWRIAAATYDLHDSCIHTGSATFTTAPGATAAVILSLTAQYSMLHVTFNNIPDSVRTLTVTLNGALTLDTTLTVNTGTSSAVLDYDYLSATADGTSHQLSIRAIGTYHGISTVLFSADTPLSAVSGENRTYPVTLDWVGPFINHPPRFTSLRASMLGFILAGATYLDTVHAVDPDGDPLSFAFDLAPSGMNITDSIITWLPSGADAGVNDVRLFVHDGNGGRDTLEWSIDVQENTSP